MKKSEAINKTREKLLGKSAQELSYILGRYCGPSNTILCEKEFGFIIDKSTVEKNLEEKAFEESILDN